MVDISRCYSFMRFVSSGKAFWTFGNRDGPARYLLVAGSLRHLMLGSISDFRYGSYVLFLLSLIVYFLDLSDLHEPQNESSNSPLILTRAITRRASGL